MKQGRTLQEVAAELARQRESKRDFIVDTGAIEVTEDAGRLLLHHADDGALDEQFGMTDLFHRQLGSSLGIPSKYYDKMQAELPTLLSENVNGWLRTRDSRQTIRTLDGSARAFLSDRYRRIDNYEIATATLPILAEMPDVQVESCEITENRMYLKAVNKRLEAEVVPGDVVQAGVLISNSEVRFAPTVEDGKFYDFLLAAFKNMAAHMAEGGSAYIFHADTEGLNFRRAFKAAGFHISGVCVWVKESLVLGRSPYQWQHEPVLFGWLPNGKHKWFADRKQTTVWHFDKPKRSKEHPTMKPVPLLAYPIKNSSAPNGVVMDLFGGSGSTLIACEQTDRICRTMELDPKYASAIVLRFKNDNPDATVTVLRGGKQFSYDELTAES